MLSCEKGEGQCLTSTVETEKEKQERRGIQKKRELARKESGSARDGRDAHCPWFSPRQVFQLGVLVNSAGFDATLPTSALPVLSHLS